MRSSSFLAGTCNKTREMYQNLGFRNQVLDFLNATLFLAQEFLMNYNLSMAQGFWVRVTDWKALFYTIHVGHFHTWKSRPRFMLHCLPFDLVFFGFTLQCRRLWFEIVVWQKYYLWPNVRKLHLPVLGIDWFVDGHVSDGSSVSMWIKINEMLFGPKNFSLL